MSKIILAICMSLVLTSFWFLKPKANAVVDMKRLLAMASKSLAEKHATSNDLLKVSNHIQETIASYGRDKNLLIFNKAAILSNETDVTDEIILRLKK